MLSAVIDFLDKTCSPKWCSRGSMLGVVLLTFWATAHASDQRVSEVVYDAQHTATQLALENIKSDTELLRKDIEKAREEAKSGNTETVRRLERLENLLLQVLSKQSK